MSHFTCCVSACVCEVCESGYVRNIKSAFILSSTVKHYALNSEIRLVCHVMLPKDDARFLWAPANNYIYFLIMFVYIIASQIYPYLIRINVLKNRFIFYE